jgi:hypothetical protein
MKQLVSYSFEAPVGDDLLCMRTTRVRQQLEDWLGTKGNIADDGVSFNFHKSDQIGKIEHVDLCSSKGQLFEIALTEPIDGGLLCTTVKLAETSEIVAVTVGLAIGSQTLSPIYLDVRSPRFVRNLLTPPSPWNYIGTPLTSKPIDFEGEEGGDDFIMLTWNPNRSVPVVAVSDEYGSVLHPGIVEELSNDLAGLAIVARLDPLASWKVTNLKQKEWSCYSGAIRIYWAPIGNSSWVRHPLWTPQKLLSGVVNTEAAADRIRKQLRRRILGQSTFAIIDPACFAEIRQCHREEELSALRAKATTNEDFIALAEHYMIEAERIDAELKKQNEANDELKRIIQNYQYALQWKDDSQEVEEVEPEIEAQLSTVEEAVNAAREKIGDLLVFGNDVNEGVKKLNQFAGPPPKIFDYLSALANLTIAKQKGPLGVSDVDWLKDRNINASGENRITRDTPKEIKNRTWDDGSDKQRAFYLHLKPSDGTSPDRCVRIYFEYDEIIKKTIIGWVGRHPG